MIDPTALAMLMIDPPPRAIMPGRKALHIRNIAVTDIAEDLLTVRDLLRYAMSRYGAAEIGIGHGTSEAIDDAVFLILESLHLPIDDINPWLDARLTRAERQLIIERIDRRIDERIPTPYLVGKAYIQGVPFVVDPRVIVPRSFIGELLFSEAFSGEGEGSLIRDPDDVLSVADICTGSGCLAILAAMIFPNAAVDAVDLSRPRRPGGHRDGEIQVGKPLPQTPDDGGLPDGRGAGQHHDTRRVSDPSAGAQPGRLRTGRTFPAGPCADDHRVRAGGGSGRSPARS